MGEFLLPSRDHKPQRMHWMAGFHLVRISGLDGLVLVSLIVNLNKNQNYKPKITVSTL